MAGFQEEVSVNIPGKCIIALAPHTSNWDFIIGNLYRAAKGMHTSFLIKKEWFFWPMRYFMYAIGGIPVYRTGHLGCTDLIASEAKRRDAFILCITPEGTRKANPEWKKGFYYIALKADMPILLYGLDYERKKIVCNRIIHPSGDVEKEMIEIKAYFKSFKGRHPKRFAI